MPTPFNRLSPSRALAALVGFAAILGLGAGSTPAGAEVVLEDKGLDRKDRWTVGKRYDDLSDPTDRPGVITSGKDPRNPSGPAVDFENRPGTPERGR